MNRARFRRFRFRALFHEKRVSLFPLKLRFGRSDGASLARTKVARVTEYGRGSGSALARSTTNPPMLSLLGLSSRISLAAALLFTAAPLLVCASADAQPTSGNALVARYADVLGTANARLPLAARRDLAERVLLLSSYYKIDPCLLAALVTVESAWHSRAVSPVGALGYGQLMPGTASALHVDALEPYENLDGTARYLRRMLNRFAGRDQLTRMQLALASYNAGSGAVDRYHGIPPYRETRAYVANVLRTRQTFVASIGRRDSNNVVPLLARVTPSPRRVSATSRKAQRHGGRLALATSAKRPYHLPYLDAADPNSVPFEKLPPVRYEPSRSFVARFLGLRHRVAAAAATPAAAPDATTLTAPY
jgi:soluble lytic murein transglycosylase-like protein